jgi:glycerol-3-phosphate dehydrogenase
MMAHGDQPVKRSTFQLDTDEGRKRGSEEIERMADFDLAIIGGGINGAAIARDASGRGLRVLLVEQNDLASGTSWASTKLIHGGLRYLEQGAFRLVREGLRERSLLLAMAPHLIWPARFVLPHHAALRPVWQLRFGLFIYDLLSGHSTLPGTSTVNLSVDPAGVPLQPQFKMAFEYSDCRVDDVRLVVLNAVDAAEQGATIQTRTRFEGAQRGDGLWHLKVKPDDRPMSVITARALINASGPWVERVNQLMPRDVVQSQVKLVKGSHIVVPRLFEHEKSYIFQNADGRIVFAIPYEQNFTMIGTTDSNFSGDPAKVSASPDEVCYLCKVATDYFRNPVLPTDVVWSFAGIRALYDNRTAGAKDLSRDYMLELDGDKNNAPLLSVYGGKLTAARHLAELALARLAPLLPMSPRWTDKAPLPGGDFAWDGATTLMQRARDRWPFLSALHVQRLIRAYGTRIDRVIGDATCFDDLGVCFGGNLTAREVHYLIHHEWAKSAEDVLWRRSKLGLHLTVPQQENLAKFMAREVKTIDETSIPT